MINQRYIIRKKLGEGRSKVFSVIDSEFPEKEIAMKILPLNVLQEEKEAFRQEYFTLRKLDHPNIIKAYEIGNVLTIDDEIEDIEPGSFYITLERFDSVEMLDFPSLNNEETLQHITRQICSILFYLHQSNYIYYDLKPQNILISEKNGSPYLKIIDLGFARYVLSEYEQTIRGTAEYIAPELLKKESHDHAVDLYSLGILLYRVIYGRFPFDAKDEIDIYKAQIEIEFEFPATNISQKFVNVVKKLLQKDPHNRYGSALQVLSDLGIELNIQITKDFLPARILSGRKDILNVVRSYLNDNKSNEIFSLRGFSGSGKSEILSELHAIYANSVYIENTRRKTGIELIRFLFHKLFFNNAIYEYVSIEDQEFIKHLFSSDEIEVSDSLKSFLARVTENKDLLLLLDDFNLYDDLFKETINDIFPILQINKIKVVIAETSEYDYATGKVFNLRDIHLTPFTDRQLAEYLDEGYSTSFPRHRLKKVILDYSDMLPGSIIQFIKDIVILGVMKYEYDDVKFVYEDNIEESLKGSNEEIYRLRLSNLSENELKVAQLVSAFNISVDQIVLSSILNKSSKDIENILLHLQYKNIINPLSLSNSPNIIADNFKRYIYNTINEKRKYHLIIASLIKRALPEFDTIELARQYKLGGEVRKVVELVNKEIQRAENLSAYSYKRKLIEDLLVLDVNDDLKASLLSELIKTLFRLSDFNELLNGFNKVNFNLVNEQTKTELTFIKGSSLIALRQITEGIKTLNELLAANIDQSTKQKVFVEIAYGEFEQGHYKSAEDIALSVLMQVETSDEDKGKCFNLLGMIKVYSDDDLISAINYFNQALEMYKKAQLPRRVAGVEVNLGNIYNMNGEYEKSEKHWDSALRINESIGNLEQEAAILINYGVYFLYKLKIERSIQHLSRSNTIFAAIGNEINQGLVLINLGEVYHICCDYQKSFDSLNQASSIFRQLKHDEELANSLFDLGKLSYELNNIDILNKTIGEYNICIQDKDFSSKYTLNLSILNLIKRILAGTHIDIDEAIEILNELDSIGEKRGYTDFLIIFVNYFIHRNLNEIEKIFAILNNQNLLVEMKNNFLLASYREYFLGKIASVYKDKRLSTPIEHFERAFHLIEKESITELTWRVLAAMSDSYIQRGLVNKAKKPLIYAAELLNYIAEKINKPELRNNYLNEDERKKVFEDLKYFNHPTFVQ